MAIDRSRGPQCSKLDAARNPAQGAAMRSGRRTRPPMPAWSVRLPLGSSCVPPQRPWPGLVRNGRRHAAIVGNAGRLLAPAETETGLIGVADRPAASVIAELPVPQRPSAATAGGGWVSAGKAGRTMRAVPGAAWRMPDPLRRVPPPAAGLARGGFATGEAEPVHLSETALRVTSPSRAAISLAGRPSAQNSFRRSMRVSVEAGRERSPAPRADAYAGL